jgi:peptidoglycan-associated lipoprotein
VVAAPAPELPVLGSPEPAPTPPEIAELVEERPFLAPAPLADETVEERSLEDLNLDSPLPPVFFGLDGSGLDATARTVVEAAAETLKEQSTWTVTIEGHCDERGTAEYNLALGERRATAARDYLVSLGISADRLKSVSYGKEFPFDAGHTESAWAQNRRAHFVITAK